VTEPAKKVPPDKGFIARTWAFIWSPSSIPLGVLVIGGIILGLAGWGVLNVTMAATNSEAFCISCHEMRSNAYEELKKTVHYQNRTGVQATCPDCHVPHEFFPKIWTKITRTSDVYYHLLGTLDTPEKYEQKRPHMAESVWAAMKAIDSRECRNCHSPAAMDPQKQTAAAQGAHMALQAGGVTCVDCHRGIAHKLP
jgi:cytochrome c-type protein NapC